MVTLRDVATPAPSTWRPCCGTCRGERLRVVFDPRPALTSHHWVCDDCGVAWDGSALSALEASERGPAPPPPDVTLASKAAQRGD